MKEQKFKIAVLGAGHGGLAMAGHLALNGFSVNIYSRSEDRLWGIKSTGRIVLEGEVEGEGFLNLVTNDIKKAIEEVELIMAVVPATAHRFLAEECAPYLKNGQIVILNPGRTFGAIEFNQVLKEKGCEANVIIGEAQTFIYASRALGPGQVKIFRIKNSIPVATLRAHKIPKAVNKLRIAYPQFVPGDNVFKTSFDNIGAVFHPTLCVMNAGWIEDISEFQFYIQGISPSVVKVLEKVDNERIKVAEALGIRAISTRDWLYLAYGAVGENLLEAIRANPGYRGITAPTTLKMRYIDEDVPTSLVPISSIGKKFKVATPTIDSVINLASILNNKDYIKEGRTVEKLHLENLTLKELRRLAIGQD
ncbi:MAG: NAD/NADP octopine/nopaline dehydrogenase family protein [Candidatus Kapaibacterium sp.]